MFSRRVFELLACDAAVLTTESEGVERTFGELVPVVTTPDQATEALTNLIHDDVYRREIVVPARRLVMTQHTYRQRLGQIAQTMGYSVSTDLGDGIAALALIDDADQARMVSDLVAAISSQRSVPAEFLIGLGLETSVAGDLHELAEARSDVRVQVVQQDQGGERTNRFRELASLASSPWVGIVDPAHHYGEYHFMDLLVCTRFADADVIGSAAFEVISDAASTQDDLELSYVDSVHPHSAIASRKLVVNRGWPDRMPNAGETLREWSSHGVRFFSGNATNFRADPALGLPPRAAARAVESAYAG
jgi:Glycosyl transferases group 1